MNATSKQLAALIAGVIVAQTALAGSATWNSSPTSGDWNTAANWTPATVPNSSTAAATFSVSSITNISLSATTQVASITFNAGASAYTISAFATQLLIEGTGVTNNSGVTQNFEFGGQDWFFEN